MQSLRFLNNPHKEVSTLEYIEEYMDLKSLIRARFKTQDKFALAMGISVCSVSKKLNGKAQWTAPEIRKACAMLCIPAEHIPRYFF